MGRSREAVLAVAAGRSGTDDGVMTGDPLWGNDAHYLISTARSYGWQVTRCADGSVRMSKPDHTMWALFTPAGAFHCGSACGPGCLEAALRMAETLDLLEHADTPRPPAPRP